MFVSFASEPASPGQPNEDFAAATPEAVVLLDGAGTPDGLDSGCSHGVAWFTRQLGTALISAVTRRKDADLADCLGEAIRAVAALHDDSCDLDHPGSPSATVAAIRTQGALLEYLVLADSVLVLDLPAGARVITDDREARAGRDLRTRMDALPSNSPAHKDAHRDYVQALRSCRNREGGFWVADARPEAAAQALTGSVPRTEIHSAALLSDGASRLADRFCLASWPDVLTVLHEHGPHELIRRTRQAEASDPTGSRWPRGKTRDDATAAYCTTFGC